MMKLIVVFHSFVNAPKNGKDMIEKQMQGKE
jgi:hypothetical protein